MYTVELSPSTSQNKMCFRSHSPLLYLSHCLSQYVYISLTYFIFYFLSSSNIPSRTLLKSSSHVPALLFNSIQKFSNFIPYPILSSHFPLYLK
jgi:hypothetical protein